MYILNINVENLLTKFISPEKPYLGGDFETKYPPSIPKQPLNKKYMNTHSMRSKKRMLHSEMYAESIHRSQKKNPFWSMKGLQKNPCLYQVTHQPHQRSNCPPLS